MGKLRIKKLELTTVLTQRCHCHHRINFEFEYLGEVKLYAKHFGCKIESQRKMGLMGILEVKRLVRLSL
jgi:hypothetical protein